MLDDNTKKALDQVSEVIDENGVVYSEHTTDGISIDFVDARWCIKQGELKPPKTYQD